MVELESALADYKHVYEKSPVDKHPSIWAAHYVDDGAPMMVWGTPKSVRDATLTLLSPFGLTDGIHASFIVLDRVHHVYVLALHKTARGVKSTYWTLAHHLSDTGDLSFGVATKEPNPIKGIEAAVDVVFNRRMTGPLEYTAEQAVAGAVLYGKAHASD